MRRFAVLLFAMLALAGSHSSVLADGLTYTGSPKFGATFVRTNPDASCESWMRAHAEMPRTPPVRVRGGIGLRTP
jgi:hypothetical protein